MLDESRNQGGLLNRNDATSRLIILAAVAAFAMAVLPGCDSSPAALTLGDLSGWMTATPNPVGVGQDVTRSSYIYNSHATDTAYVDSTVIDTIHFIMDFKVFPGDTAFAVEHMGLTYPSAGTYVHTLTYYTTIGVVTCPPCTVVVQ
jgi:hypothetical protein